MVDFEKTLAIRDREHCTGRTLLPVFLAQLESLSGATPPESAAGGGHAVSVLRICDASESSAKGRAFASCRAGHPLYLAYTIDIIGFVINNPSAHNIAVMAVGSGFQVLRIYYEEAVLLQYSDYARYAVHTKWRLIPLVW